MYQACSGFMFLLFRTFAAETSITPIKTNKGMKTSERVLEEVLTIRARLRSRIINDLIERDLCQDLCCQGQDSRRDTAQG